MATINQVKQLAEADTPLLFFQCVLPSGASEYWCTHAVALNGATYSARVLKHNLFTLQLSADDAMDGITQLSLTLANADSYISELNRQIGLKGSQLTVYFAFADLPSQTITTEATILFRGVAGDPDEITEDALTLTFTNKLSLQRVAVPDARIQRSCPWTFPTTLAQRTEAVTGGGNGRFSRYYRCGYSADVPGGCGNLNSGAAFTSCDNSRAQCIQRGMFSQDQKGNATARFGGFEFVPSVISVRTSGAKTAHDSPLDANTAKYNDPVPLIYGTGWLKAPVDFARNDGNLTHMEAILGLGPIDSVLKVVVNDVEIPLATPGTDLSATGWYSVVTAGTRNGAFNMDFTDGNGDPLGDPSGSIALLSIVAPNRISSGGSLPNVEVLLRGIQIDSFTAGGALISTAYSNNPAWVILDILRRSGWSLGELNLATFAQSAQYCGALISTTDSNGNPLQVPRYECNLILTKRQSAASVVRGIRVASSLMLRYGPTGLLELIPETDIARQQPQLPDGSNSVEPLNSGWPAYEFSDGSSAFSGILRMPNGASSVRLSSRTVAETSNRLSVEFQDSFNEFQQDSLSVVDAEDSALIGYEISSQSTALGISNMNQATRVLLRQLDKSTAGNLYIEFQTSFRALKVRPGDIITVTYAKEGLVRVPFRVTKLAPSLNYQTVTVQAQIHDDNWYSDSIAVLSGPGRQPFAALQIPRPLLGTVPDKDVNGNITGFELGLAEQLQAQADGTAIATVAVSFVTPAAPYSGFSSLPLVSLSPQYASTGGTLMGGVTLYYAVSAVDSNGNESGLSFTVPASVPSGSNTNTVTLTGLSFPASAASFNVYRGASPQVLYRIASQEALATTFTDTGLADQPVGPPDAAFDHANFYWRQELAGPLLVTAATATTVASQNMGAVPGAYAGRTIRIMSGTGRGQERLISGNDDTTITAATAWSVTPDTSSEFVIAENGWKFAAVGSTSPVQFQLPYQTGVVVEVTGRAASVTNVEAAPELSPVTSVALGGGKADSGTAAAPDFQLTAPGAGLVTLSQVGFNDLTNTSSVTTGTLQLFYWNELTGASAYSLGADLDASSGTVQLAQNVIGHPGQVIQIGSELMTIVSASSANNTYTVTRGALSSTIAAHNSGDTVLHLNATTTVVPFAMNFFENRASLNFEATMTLPDVRICGAQFYVTNSFGDSGGSQACYTTGTDGGLRTLSGGQFSLQVAGTLATQQNASPPLLVEASHAVRDLRASVTQAATGYNVSIDILQNGTEYCNIVIPSGATVSAVTDGVNLAPLAEGASLTANVTLQVISGYTGQISPGRDLTVTIRL